MYNVVHIIYDILLHCDVLSVEYVYVSYIPLSTSASVRAMAKRECLCVCVESVVGIDVKDDSKTVVCARTHKLNQNDMKFNWTNTGCRVYRIKINCNCRFEPFHPFSLSHSLPLSLSLLRSFLYFNGIFMKFLWNSCN